MEGQTTSAFYFTIAPKTTKRQQFFYGINHTMHLSMKTRNMKLLFKAALGVCLLASMSANAQSKTAPAKNGSKTTAVKKADPVTEFKKRNPDVKSIWWDPGMMLTIEKVDGTKEVYSMDVFKDEQKAKSLYGDIPTLIPPPPPPVAPEAPAIPPPPPPVPAKP
jgi:hypothetical protein